MIISDSDNTRITTVHVNNLKMCHAVNVPTKLIGTRGRPKKERIKFSYVSHFNLI